MCVYNSLPVCRQAIEACVARLAAYPRGNAKLYLVNNYSPDPAVQEYLREIGTLARDVVVLVPAKNFGCHHGWNYAYQHITHPSHAPDGHAIRYLVKLDDDTVVRTWDWLAKMTTALDSVPECGYVSADIDAKQVNEYRIEEIDGFKFEIPDRGIVGFSCVMFRRSWVDEVGFMNASGYRDASGNIGESTPRLYGGEEATYALAARRRGEFIAHLPSVFCHHLGNEQRDPDYAMWKWVYGYMGWTRLDMQEWRRSPEYLQHYRKRLAMEAKAEIPNDVILRDLVKRLGDISDGS